MRGKNLEVEWSYEAVNFQFCSTNKYLKTRNKMVRSSSALRDIFSQVRFCPVFPESALQSTFSQCDVFFRNTEMRFRSKSHQMLLTSIASFVKIYSSISFWTLENKNTSRLKKKSQIFNETGFFQILRKIWNFLNSEEKCAKKIKNLQSIPNMLQLIHSNF